MLHAMVIRRDVTPEELMNFRFEREPVSLTFADRLANENGWRIAYADRVIEEYKKFLYLAAVVDHPVSPSDAVDQAWHLHLLYTQSYWDDLCRDVLGRPLHHGPTLGGAAEQAKHDDWYERTLGSYRRLLAAEPPGDIWPSLAAWKRVRARHERVDRDRYWLIPKPRLPIGMKGHPAKVPCFFAVPFVAVLNPLDLTGPEFLWFIVVMMAVALVAGLFMRRWDPNDTVLDDQAAPLEPHELAFLNGGQKQMLQAVLAGMIQAGELEVRRRGTGAVSTGERRLRAVGAAPNDAIGLGRLIHREAGVDGGLAITDLPRVVASFAKRTKQALEDRGLVSSGLARLLPAAPMLLVLLLGIAKVCVGVNRDRPVGFLVVLAIVATVAAVLLAKPPLLTNHGQRVLRRWKSEHASLRKIGAEADALDPATLMLAVALFGIASSSTPQLNELRAAVGPGNRSSGCGSSCGGSGCGGGGGGCGGCGGCGGD
jgi:uncharacterized protein (TIGR04222 family)